MPTQITLHYLVGAAIQTTDGQIFAGCNVENASYGLTICAERVAAATAIAAGQRSFTAVAIATARGGTPCGACRQFLAEFAPNLKILLVDTDNSNATREVTLGELLPDQFKM